MQRDYERITRQLESVCDVLEQASQQGIVMTMQNACKQARVSQSYLCKIIDNADQYQINPELIERFDYARCLLFDVIIQEVSGVGNAPVVKGGNEGETGDATQTEDDSPLKIARSKLKLDASKWLYARLMPNLLGDKVTVNNTGATNNTLIIAEQVVSQLDTATLKQIANTKLIESK